jgi:GT2 family glycosyltransferase
MYYTYARIASSSNAACGVGLFYTSIAAIRKDIFERMGGFDSNYHGASVTEDIEFGQRLLTAGLKVRLDSRLMVEHLRHYSLGGLLKTDLERAFGLSKTWLRKKLEPRHRAAGQKYYTSVPWFFIVGVPFAWLLPLFVILVLWTGRLQWAAAAGITYLAILMVNVPFLNGLREARGWRFLFQSVLFLPFDLWVSGLGVLWAVVDYLRGNRY